jgi:hypothetical protein
LEQQPGILSKKEKRFVPQDRTLNRMSLTIFGAHIMKNHSRRIYVFGMEIRFFSHTHPIACADIVPASPRSLGQREAASSRIPPHRRRESAVLPCRCKMFHPDMIKKRMFKFSYSFVIVLPYRSWQMAIFHDQGWFVTLYASACPPIFGERRPNGINSHPGSSFHCYSFGRFLFACPRSLGVTLDHFLCLPLPLPPLFPIS